MRDRKGFTPLQHALRSPRNRECAVILLESDAYFDFEIFETEHGTLLHEMYVSEDTSHLLRLTELMLEKVRVCFFGQHSTLDTPTHYSLLGCEQ